MLELTEKGQVVTDPGSSEQRRARACIGLAIDGIAPFKIIWDRYAGNRLPSVEVLRDAAREAGVDEDQIAECVETFLANARGVGLIRNIAGSERLLTLDDALDALGDRPATGGATTPNSDADPPAPVRLRVPPRSGGAAAAHLDQVCFVISPIGDEGSDQRLHADLVLGSLIEPALRELGLEAVRADKISKPGLITGQVIDHLTRARMVIADLSFANPNVYYELALRHAIRRPVVQIIRTSDKLPFDVGQFRTVTVDMSSIYALVPALDLHRQEVTRRCRAALEEGESAESPLSQFYPRFWEHVPHPSS